MSSELDSIGDDGALPEVHAGFIPLLDCAPLIVARELALDRKFGFSLVLHREVSWANIRDKLDLGVFDCAHMLAPMPLAARLGLGRSMEPLIVPMSLSLNGNAITVSHSLYEEMSAEDAAAVQSGGLGAARALAGVVASRQVRGAAPLTLGMVYPFSSHNYDLRYWLASAGIDPDNDVNLIVVPPPLIVESLAHGRVDGFCVGEPWNSLAVSEDLGVIIATKSELWAQSPEKVLGVRADWAANKPALLDGLVCALVTACDWLRDQENREKIAPLLAEERHVGVSADVLLRALTGRMQFSADRDVIVDDMIVFQRGGATFPWRSHAIWFLTQMIRWGQVREPFSIAGIAEEVYRPDVYRRAVSDLGVDVPEQDHKLERGAAFFAEAHFDPETPLQYLKGLEVRHRGADLDAYAPLNGAL